MTGLLSLHGVNETVPVHQEVTVRQEERSGKESRQIGGHGGMDVYRYQEEDEGLYPPSRVCLSHLTPTLGHLLYFADKISGCCFFLTFLAALHGFPNQGSNLDPSHWKYGVQCGVVTTGDQWTSYLIFPISFFFFLSFILILIGGQILYDIV